MLRVVTVDLDAEPGAAMLSTSQISNRHKYKMEAGGGAKAQGKRKLVDGIHSEHGLREDYSEVGSLYCFIRG